ncbi:MAG: hypothetical protein P1V36_08575 [Planctomycetota bacterium]|nr:hypothetical protein [Planctomycetota bacterium]
MNEPYPNADDWIGLGPDEMRFEPVGLERVVRLGAAPPIEQAAYPHAYGSSGAAWVEPHAGIFLPKINWPPAPPPPSPEMPSGWREGLGGAGLGGYRSYVSYRIGFVGDLVKKSAWTAMQGALAQALSVVQSYGYSEGPMLNEDYDAEVALITNKWLACDIQTKPFLDELYNRSIVLVVLELMDNGAGRDAIGQAIAVVGASFDKAYAAAGEKSARVPDA